MELLVPLVFLLVFFYLGCFCSFLSLRVGILGVKKQPGPRIISLAQAVYLFIAVEKLGLFFLHLLYSFIAFSAVLFQ